MRALLVLAAALLVAGTAAGASAPTAAVTATLLGLNDVTSGGFEPPDTQVAAGPGFVVEMVNLAERVWSTSTGTPQLLKSQSLPAFFGVPNDQLTDPRIVYDASTGRWLASIADEETDGVLLAVSRTGDPTGGWSIHSFVAPGCADQPRLGLSDTVVVLAADVFANCGEAGPAPVVGGELWVVNKRQLLSDAAAVASTTYGPDPAYSSLAPVQSLSSTSTEYVVSVDTPSSRVVHLLAVDGTPPAAVAVREIATLPISPLQQPPPARQPNAPGVAVTPALATNDDRVLDAVWENGKLWLSANTGCTPAGDSFFRTCARLIELSTAGTPSVDWDSDLGFPGAYLFYPAIRPDSSGNLVIVVGEVSPTVLPELLVLARTPDGTFTAPTVVAQGVSPHLGLRYGDYFGAARDGGNPKVIWVAGEAGTDVRGGHGWTTAVASVQVTGPGASPPAVAGQEPPGLRALPVIGMRGVPVRLSYRALDDGSRVKAVVVVSRGNVVYFQAATAAGSVLLNQVYSVPWRPGAKLHGMFTFCVHAVGTGGLRSPVSCAGISVP